MSLHRLQNVVRLPARLVTAIAADPADLWIRTIEKLSERREWWRTPCEYVADPKWEQRLHALLGHARLAQSFKSCGPRSSDP